MKFLKFRLAVFLAFALCILPSAWSSPEYRSIAILHTNDMHDRLLPFDYLPGDEGNINLPYEKNVGGIARIASLAEKIEKEQRGNVLLLDAGDALEGTAFCAYFKGEADFAAFSAAGYDAMTCGNHEMSISLEELRRNVQLAAFPVLSANLIDSKTGKLALAAYEIFTVDGVKIAVFGLTPPMDTSYKAVVDGLGFHDPIEDARGLVPELRKEADIVVALSHLGVDDDIRLAKTVPGIDVIVGGHSHTRLTSPIFISNNEEPDFFSVGGTVIVHAFQFGSELGRLDLILRRNGGPFTLMSYTGTLIPVTSAIPDDPHTAAVVDSYYRRIAKNVEEVIGQAASNFTQNAALNMVTDSIREAAGTDYAVYPWGHVKTGFAPGQIRKWDIFTMLPFDNGVVVMDLTGAQLRRLLLYQIPGVSGMSYRRSGWRLTEILIGGKPLEENKTYRVATVESMAKNSLPGVPYEVIRPDHRKVVIKYIETRNTISPDDNRRRIIE